MKRNTVLFIAFIAPAIETLFSRNHQSKIHELRVIYRWLSSIPVLSHDFKSQIIEIKYINNEFVNISSVKKKKKEEINRHRDTYLHKCIIRWARMHPV